VVAQRTAAAEASAKTITLGKLVNIYLEDRRAAKRKGSGEPLWRPRYLVEVELQLTRYWNPLAGMAVQAVARQEIVKVIDDIAAKHGAVTADRARAALSGLYVWAIDRGYCDASPIVHIKPRATGGARERTLSAQELREVCKAADVIGGDYSRIVKLLILTGQRREEIGSLGWTEIHDNGDGVRIEIPGERTKNHRKHIVPLSPEAVAALPQRPDADDRVMVFGRLGTGFSGWSKSKHQLDDAIARVRRQRRIRAAMPPWRLHDLRRTFVTMVGELGFAPPHIVEAIVNHISGTKAGVAGTYNKALYLDERKLALAAWGHYVKDLVESSKP
jgi:integrase